MKQKILLLLLMLMGLSGSLGLNAQNSTKEAYVVLNGTKLTFYFDNERSVWEANPTVYTTYDLNTGWDAPGWYDIRTSITSVVFAPSFANARPTKCEKWFDGMCNLLFISGINYLNLDEATDLSFMFRGCTKLKSLNLGTLNTANVSNMTSMFENCSSLTSLDLSGLTFKINALTNYLLKNCTGLQELTLPATANNIFNDAFFGVGSTDHPVRLTYPEDFTPSGAISYDGYFTWNSGYFYHPEKEAYYILEYDYDEYVEANLSCTFTFYYDDQWDLQDNARMVTQNGQPLDLSYAKYVEHEMHIIFDNSFADFRPTNTSYWFSGLDIDLELHFYHLENLNTSEVTDMSHMFDGIHAIGLATGSEPGAFLGIDVSHFDTRKVTDMSYMFANINTPVTFQLDLSSFNTSNVTDMSYMFSGSTYLTNLDLSSFNTSNVTDMSCMFSGCATLTSLNLSGFNTSNVNSMISMFKDCDGLASLDLSSFTFITGVSSTGFLNSSSLQSLSLSSTAKNLRDNAFSGVGTQSAPCALIYPFDLTINPSATGNGWFKWKAGYFKESAKGYVVLSDNYETMTFYYNANATSQNGTKCDLNIGSDYPDWYALRNRVKSVVFDPSFANARPTSCFNWFVMEYLTSITGMENLNTSEVTNMGGMFKVCGLKNIDLSHFNTGKVTNMEEMFYLSDLTSLDLSRFTFNTNTNSANMMKDCYALQTLTIPATANYLNANACTNVGTQSAPCTLVYPIGFTPDKQQTGNGWYKWKNGYFKYAGPEPYAVLDGTTLSFYYDMNRGVRNGTTYDLNTGNNEPGWNANASSVTSVVFDSSFADARPTSCYCWFLGMNNLTTITGIGNLKTDEVTTMYGMFGMCTSLTSLDVSGFNTSKVTSMQMMFSSCSGLTRLDVSRFDTSKVTSTGYMFDFCSGLTSLDVSGFDTSNVIFMDAMFFYCSNLTSLDVSGFNTANVTGMGSMFHSCSSLTSLNVSGFDTSNVTVMNCMFYGCSGLTSLDVSGFNTSKVNIMSGMFMDCSGLTSLDLSNFTLNSIASDAYDYMLQNCSGLQTLTVPANADRLGNDACQGVGTQAAPCTLVYPVGFTPEKTATGEGWYQWKNGYFKDAPMPYAELSSDNTTLTFHYDNQRDSRTGTTYDMNTENNNPGWCNYRNNVTAVVFDPSFADAHPTNCYRWFRDMENLESIEGLENLNTSEVMTMFEMFYNCSSLTSLDLSGFDTSKLLVMSYMFYGCSNLTSLDVSRFNTENVAFMNNTFNSCSSLTSLDVSHFNTAKVTLMSSMFRNCSSLTSLDLSSFTIPSSSSLMMENCSSLQTLTIPATTENLNANACTGVGTESAPCTLVYPVGFIPEKTATGDGWYQWKSGYFKDAPMPYAELSSDNTTLTFHYDNQRDSRTGTTYDLNTENNNPGWYEHRTSVTTVVFDPTFADARPSSCFSWFIMIHLNSITGLEYLNTSAVTNMVQMFMGCPLESIDVSHFNTANVTAMGGMFNMCSNLKSINLSSFNTDRVDDPYGGFNFIFSNCTSLTNLDLSNFTFASVASTDYMLYGCSGLQKLAIPATATELSADACSSVGTQAAPCTLVYPDGFTPEKTAIGDGWYKWKSGYFKDAVVEPYAVLSTDNTTLTFCYDKNKGLRPGTSYDLNDGESTPGWFIYASHVSNVDFNFAFQNARPTSCYMWFGNMTNMTTIEHLDYLNTSEVTDMRYMFQRCLKLTSLDVSTFDTENVTRMSYMFDECTSLETLIGLSSFHTSNVTSMFAMFQNCSSLTELKGVNGFNMSNVFTNECMFKGCSSLTRLNLGYFQFPTRNSKMLSGCTSLQALVINPTGEYILSSDAFEGVGTATNPCILLTEAHITPDETFDSYFKWGGGFFKDAEKEPYAIFHGTTLTFVYDKWRPIIDDETFGLETGALGVPKWLTRAGDIVNVEFTPSFAEVRPTSTAWWFSYMTQATNIFNLCYLNTSEVTDMSYMFQNCKKLTNLDVSSFNTANVTFMRAMFHMCSSLTGLNVSGLNTANVTTMDHMFYGCSSLASLDVSGFNTANVTDMQNMFYNCSGLTHLNVGGSFSTAKVTNMDGMFYGCSSLTSIDVSGFNTQRVGYMGSMFSCCSSLTSLDLSNFTIPLNGYWSTMMKNCTSLQTLTVPATAGNLPAGACEGVGTKTTPCILVYPAGFTPEKDEIGDGWYKWKSGYFKDRAFPLGDVNHDGEVTILDVTLLVDHLLAKNPSPFYTENADVSGDEVITITDVTALVNILLHQSASHAPATAREATFDCLWLTTDGSHCLLHLDTPERYNAMHLTLRLPEGGSMGNMRLSSSRSAGHHVSMQPLGDGLYNIVLHSNDNAELRSDNTALLHFDLAGCQPSDVEVAAIQSTNSLYETIMFGGTTTGMEVVEVSGDSEGDGYNTVGVRVGKNAHGVVIKNGSKKIKN